MYINILRWSMHHYLLCNSTNVLHTCIISNTKLIKYKLNKSYTPIKQSTLLKANKVLVNKPFNYWFNCDVLYYLQLS